MSPLFKKGNLSGKPYFFTKGQIPWNKGKTYTRIPVGQWSFRYGFCKNCKTREKHGRKRHYSNGLCKSCYFIELRKKDNPQMQRARDLKRREKIRNNPELHKRMLAYQAEWRRQSVAYREQFEKKKKRMRFKNFIDFFFKTSKPMKKYKKFTIVIFEHSGKDYRVPIPTTIVSGSMTDMDIFVKELFKYLEKSYPQGMTLDNDGWKRI